MTMHSWNASRVQQPNSSLSLSVSCRPRLLRDRRCTTAGILTCRNLIEGMPTTAPGLDKPSTLQQVQAATSHVTCFNQDSTSLCTCRPYVGKGAPATAPSCEVCGEQSATVGNLATRQCMLRPISKDDQAQIANKSLSGRKPGQTEGGWAANQGSMLGLYGARGADDTAASHYQVELRLACVWPPLPPALHNRAAYCLAWHDSPGLRGREPAFLTADPRSPPPRHMPPRAKASAPASEPAPEGAPCGREVMRITITESGHIMSRLTWVTCLRTARWKRLWPMQ